MQLNEIKSLAKKKRYAEALAACNELLENTPNLKAEVLRTRAYVFTRSGDYEKAIQDREELFDTGEAALRDYYLAADNALYAGNHEQACKWFEYVINQSKQQNEMWFMAASHFLLAYAQMKLGEYSKASENLNQAITIESDISMPVPGSCGMYTHQQLKQDIERAN